MTLALAVLQCERFYGTGWYFNPARWTTVDGYAPWAVVWIAWRAMHAVSASERLSMTKAIGMALSSGEAGKSARDDEVRAAFPPDASEAPR